MLSRDDYRNLIGERDRKAAAMVIRTLGEYLESGESPRRFNRGQLLTALGLSPSAVQTNGA